jgi:bacillolysin
MLTLRARIVSVAGLALVAPSLGFAADSTTFFNTNEAFQSLQRAYQAVHSDTAVQELLRDSNVNALSIASKVSNNGVETTKFQHYYKGLEVMGSMTFHHATDEGASVRNVISHFDLDVKPALSPETAVVLAKAVAGDRELTQAPELKILPSQSDGSARLVYLVDLATQGLSAGSDVMIDAQTGRVLANISKLETLAPVQVVSAKKQGLLIYPVVKKNDSTGKFELESCKATDQTKGSDTTLSVDDCKKTLRGLTPLTDNQCQLVLMDAVKPGDTAKSGEPVMIDPSACKQVVSNGTAAADADQSAKNALANSNKVLAYFKNVHGRDSFDGNGGEIVNVVHAAVAYANAAWVQGLDFMLYGDGDGEMMGDMTKGLDVAGHEMTHGITSKTAKLGRQDQSGALNEANSDFFGKMIAQDGSWMVGKSLSLDLSKFAGIRDLANPATLKHKIHNADGDVIVAAYPAKLSEAQLKKDTTTCDGSNDNCWVHHNSTVSSHALYLIHQSIGKAKAEALQYLTLTSFLTSEADFRKAAHATLDACSALTKTGKLTASDCDKAKAAFVATEVL